MDALDSSTSPIKAKGTTTGTHTHTRRASLPDPGVMVANAALDQFIESLRDYSEGADSLLSYVLGTLTSASSSLSLPIGIEPSHKENEQDEKDSLLAPLSNSNNLYDAISDTHSIGDLCLLYSNCMQLHRTGDTETDSKDHNSVTVSLGDMRTRLFLRWAFYDIYTLLYRVLVPLVVLSSHSRGETTKSKIYTWCLQLFRHSDWVVSHHAIGGTNTHTNMNTLIGQDRVPLSLSQLATSCEVSIPSTVDCACSIRATYSDIWFYCVVLKALQYTISTVSNDNTVISHDIDSNFFDKVYYLMDLMHSRILGASHKCSKVEVEMDSDTEVEVALEIMLRILYDGIYKVLLTGRSNLLGLLRGLSGLDSEATVGVGVGVEEPLVGIEHYIQNMKEFKKLLGFVLNTWEACVYYSDNQRRGQSRVMGMLRNCIHVYQFNISMCKYVSQVVCIALDTSSQDTQKAICRIAGSLMGIVGVPVGLNTTATVDGHFTYCEIVSGSANGIGNGIGIGMDFTSSCNVILLSTLKQQLLIATMLDVHNSSSSSCNSNNNDNSGISLELVNILLKLLNSVLGQGDNEVECIEGMFRRMAIMNDNESNDDAIESNGGGTFVCDLLEDVLHYVSGIKDVHTANGNGSGNGCVGFIRSIFDFALDKLLLSLRVIDIVSSGRNLDATLKSVLNAFLSSTEKLIHTVTSSGTESEPESVSVSDEGETFVCSLTLFSSLVSCKCCIYY